jgi:hypothetical protein
MSAGHQGARIQSLLSIQCLLQIAILAGLLPCGGADATDEWQRIFDGRSLEGWRAKDPRYWSVEDGSIVGRITAETPCTQNQYLVWLGGELADFELKLKSRLRGEGGINNGFQFRSRLLPDHDVCGYQMDNNLQTPWLARLYDEYGRHTLAMRGERTVFEEDGRRVTTPLEEGQGPAWFGLEDWHEYHLTCVGPRITLRINGRLAAEVVDHDPQRRDLQGILALQLHSGPPTLVEFRDIFLKVLKAAETAVDAPETQMDRNHEVLRRQAAAWWSMDTGGHGATPSLRHYPEFDLLELNTKAVGPGARPRSRAVLLHGAYFESAPGILTEGQAVTLYLRARARDGVWDAGLFGKRADADNAQFNLLAMPRSSGAGSEIVWEVQTDQGRGRVSFPVSSIEADAWLDLVARYDGARLSLFANGVAMAHSELKGGLIRSDAPILIAAARGPDGKPIRHFHGALETAALWARALSDEEVRALSHLSD